MLFGSIKGRLWFIVSVYHREWNLQNYEMYLIWLCDINS